jgi:hypothetical protein
VPVNFAIRVFSLILTFFGALNLVILALSDHLQSWVPAVLRPAATFGEALALFGVGAAVACSPRSPARSGRSTRRRARAGEESPRNRHVIPAAA